METLMERKDEKNFTLNPRMNDPSRPMVSVFVINYNYGRYLRECFNSILSQTYDNIEIIFSDNASTDDSWEIALEYQKQHPGVFYLARNRQNFGMDANFRNCNANNRGRYYVLLCSDDALLPDFVHTGVTLLEEHLDAGFMLAHRVILDDNGQQKEEAPFYNQSCKIRGDEQAAVYMMAAVNPSISQIIYRDITQHGNSVAGVFMSNRYNTRIHDFNICLKHSIIYVKEPLVLHRLHGKNASFSAATDLMEVIGPYVLNHQFSELASCHGYHKVTERLPASIEKIAKLAIRYSARNILNNEERTAFRYFRLSEAIFPEIIADTSFALIATYFSANQQKKSQIMNTIKDSDCLVTRTISYSPPPNSTFFKLPIHD